MSDMGFVASPMYPGVCCNGEVEVGMVAHVDDLLCSGKEQNLLKVKEMLTRKDEVKGRRMNEGNLRGTRRAHPLQGIGLRR